MRKRNVHIQFWLNDTEADNLNKLVCRSGLSRENYLRHIITGLVPTDRPPPDYYSMMRELHKIGTNLNQIAHKANALNTIDADRYDANAAALNRAIIEITKAVMLPHKRE
jgi:hypothetical protein